MRLLAVALLFVTALTAQRGMGGFRGNGGFRAPGGFAGHGRWTGGGFRGGGSHVPGRPSHGFIGGGHYGGGHYGGGHYGGGFRYGRSVYGGIWGGSYYPGWYSSYPFGWYSSSLWTEPAYPGWASYPYNSGPNVTIVTVPAATTAPSPTVVEMDRSTIYRRAVPEPAPERAENRPLANHSWAYLIAAADGTIWLAREYRVDGGTLHFATMDGNWKKLPLANVDHSLTEQLNRERGVAVDIR